MECRKLQLALVDRLNNFMGGINLHAAPYVAMISGAVLVYDLF